MEVGSCPLVQTCLSCLFSCKFSFHDWNRKEEISLLLFVFYAQWLLPLMLSYFLLPHISIMAEGLEMAGGG